MTYGLHSGKLDPGSRFCHQIAVVSSTISLVTVLFLD